jgi:hypothetical protein
MRSWTAARTRTPSLLRCKATSSSKRNRCTWKPTPSTRSAVLGYDQNDELFHKGSGQAMAGSLYGVVVFGSSESVKTHLQDAGSDAVVHEVMPLIMTAVLCKTN